MRSNALNWALGHVGFFRFCVDRRNRERMSTNRPTMAEQIGHAASAFEQVRTGHVPKSVTVVLTNDTLVITLRGILTHAERVLANTESGASWVREYHRQLFANSSNSLLDEIKRITGISATEPRVIEGTLVSMFELDAVVHVYVLAAAIPLEVWNGIPTAV